jgi:hypothetical protein
LEELVPDEIDAFAAALAAVLRQFGMRVVERPDQLRGALSDTLGASAVDHRSEMDAVVAASREGVAAQIRDADVAGASPDQIRAWFDQLVAAGVSLRDAALATRSWAQVLDASETARVTSEVSEAMLGSGADESPSTGVVVGSTGTDAAGDAIPAFGEEAATELGESMFSGDRTRMAPEKPVSEAPVSEAPGAPETVGPTPPPSGPPLGGGVMAALRRWWPAAASGLAIVVTLAVGIPIIAANAAVPEAPDFTPVDVTDDSGLFDRRDLARFALTVPELAQLVPTATQSGEPIYHSEDAYNVGFTTQDSTCAGQLLLITPGVGASTGAYVNYAYDQATPWLWADSVSRWYETAEEAAAAFEAIRLDPAACSAPGLLNNGVAFASTVAEPEPIWIDGVQILRTTVTATSTPAWVFVRHCYLDVNVVSCVSVSGTNTGAVGTIDGADGTALALAEFLDERLTSVVSYREDAS